MRRNNTWSGEIGPRTPVELRETRQAGISLDVKVPRAQAFWMALPLTVAVIHTVLVPVLMGPRVFWFAAGLAAFAAFVWGLYNEIRWYNVLAWPLLVGLLATCWWAFLADNGLALPESAWLALASLASLVFWWTLTAALWLAFVQELAQRSPFQEQSLWETMGKILLLLVERPKPRERVRHLHGFVEIEEQELGDLEAFILMAQDEETLAWRRLERKGTRPSTGKPWSAGACKGMVATLRDSGHVVTQDGKPARWARGSSPAVALASLM